MNDRRKPSLPNTPAYRWCQENIPELRNADLYEAGDILMERLLRRTYQSSKSGGQ